MENRTGAGPLVSDLERRKAGMGWPDFMNPIDVYPHCDPCKRSHFSQSLADDFKVVVWRPERDGVEVGGVFPSHLGCNTFYMIVNSSVVFVWTFGRN